MVPIEEAGDMFNYTLEELLEKARGTYPSGLDKEGSALVTQYFLSSYQPFSIGSTIVNKPKISDLETLSIRIINSLLMTEAAQQFTSVRLS